MKTYERVLANLKARRERILSGKLNCIPFDLPRFTEFLPGIEQGKYLIISANHKIGKCFGKGTEIVLYDGSVKHVENITTSDVLLGPDSSPRKVEGVTKGHSMLYKITQKYGDPFVVNEDHILYLAKVTANNYSTYKTVITSKRPRKYEYLTMTVKEFLELTPSQQAKYRMVQTDEVEFYNTSKLDIPPYLYGLWLGDGDVTGPVITTIDKEIIDYLYDYAHQHQLTVVKYGDIRYALKTLPLLQSTDIHTNQITLYNRIPASNNEACYISRATKTGKIVLNCKWEWVAPKGEFYTQFNNITGRTKNNINRAYLQASKADRYELLAGLLDSDGHKVVNNNAYEIILKQESLIQDIRFLAQSLGFRAYYSPKIVNGVTYYRLRIVGSKGYKIPTKLARKQIEVNPTIYIDELCRHFTIEEVGVGEYYGFTVDQDHLFLLKDFTIVHNTQITDWLYLYTPLLYAFYNPTQIRVKIHYFTWEMSSEEKYTQAISFLLYYLSNGQIRIAPMDLRSTNSKRPLSAQIIALLEQEPYKGLLDFLDANVNFIDSIKNPTGVQIYLEDFAKNNGIIHKKKQTFRNTDSGELYEKDVFDYFEAKDPDEYWIAIFDHLSLVSPEMGLTLRDTMGKLSANVLVPLKSKYKFCFVGVQQQALCLYNLKINHNFTKI